MSLKTLWTVLLLAMAGTTLANAPDRFTSREIRQAIPVTAQERNQTLYEMRDLLHGLFNLHLALSKKDFHAAAVASRPIGHLLENMPDSMKERLPEEYIQLAIAMQESFDVLARDAEEKKDLAQVESDLAEAMTYCSGCHDAYRFEVHSPLPGRK
jgi:cytochrome c556